MNHNYSRLHHIVISLQRLVIDTSIPIYFREIVRDACLDLISLKNECIEISINIEKYDLAFIFEKICENILKFSVDKFMPEITKREEFVLQSRSQYTLKEIGVKLNVSANRIREIESKALRKLRSRISLRYKNSYHADLFLEYLFFKYLNDADLIHWYDVENDSIYRCAKDMKDNLKEKRHGTKE